MKAFSFNIKMRFYMATRGHGPPRVHMYVGKPHVEYILSVYVRNLAVDTSHSAI